jgi:uncharacterized membrane protein
MFNNLLIVLVSSTLTV